MMKTKHKIETNRKCTLPSRKKTKTALNIKLELSINIHILHSDSIVHFISISVSKPERAILKLKRIPSSMTVVS